MRNADAITDIHVHVLPGLDDGPQDIEESQALLKELADSGVQRVFCTSHYGSPHFAVTYENLVAAYEDLSPVHNNPFSLTLSPAAEVRLSPSLISNLRENRIPTLGNTHYILVEFPGNEISNDNMALIYELRVRGYLPIMAHPERNLAIQRRPQLVDELCEAGVAMQLTADCFLKGPNSNLTRDKLAWRFLESGQASIVASDAHNTSSRPPVLTQAYNHIALKYGSQLVDRLIENANAVWEDADLLRVERAKAKKRILGFL